MASYENEIATENPVKTESVKSKNLTARRSKAQSKWREKNRLTKTQLNVMARTVTHEGLSDVAKEFDLRGKAEAVAFCTYVVRSMKQKSGRDATTYLYLEALKAGFKRDRDIFSP